MKDLIKRIEAADGPDRELDVEICEAMGFTVVGHYRRGSNEPIRGLLMGASTLLYLIHRRGDDVGSGRVERLFRLDRG